MELYNAFLAAKLAGGEGGGGQQIIILSRTIGKLADLNAKNYSKVTTITASATGFTDYIDISLPAGNYVVSLTKSLTDSAALAFYNDSSSSVVVQKTFTTGTGAETWEFELSGAVTKFRAYFNAINNSFTNIMICDKDLWSVSQTYEPFALPNTVITPQLIDIIDTGHKNLLNLSNIKTLNPTGWSGNKLTLNGVDWTFNSDGSITVNGTANSNGSYPELMTDSIPVGEYILSGGSANCKFTAHTFGSDAGSGFELDVTSSTTQPIRFIGNISANKSVSNFTFKPMICSKAIWNISRKFVPYCPTMQELYGMIINST